MKQLHTYKNYFSFICLILSIVLFFGCSKKDATLVGTGVGAAIGAEAAGKNDKFLGAAAGAITGHWIGKTIGKAIEEEKADKRAEAQTQEKIRTLKRENRVLKKSIKEKWCPCCYRNVKIAGANTCPFCGHGLIVEKYCKRCSRVFEPNSSYKYCHKCTGGIRLCSR